MLFFSFGQLELAICPNSTEVHIYSKTAGKWTLAHTLSEHDKLVTSIDWAPETNRIVTCAQDRNAYVWQWDQARTRWEPTLVLLRINRAATYVRWSPKEDKFAVASGSRVISICYFEEANNWWIAKHIKKPIRSTVLSVEWHPGNVLIAAGSSDMKVRVFSSWIKGIDPKAADPVWGENLKFGNLLAEYGSPASGWVHGATFSPSGSKIAWVSHDTTVSIAEGPNSAISVIKGGAKLPNISLVFTSEDSIVAAGHDCEPLRYVSQGGNWKFDAKLDAATQKAAGGNSAFKMFQQMDSRGQTDSVSTDLKTTHQNTITSVRVFESSGGKTTKVSTSGIDGRLVIFKV